jgi:hypothetical protein
MIYTQQLICFECELLFGMKLTHHDPANQIPEHCGLICSRCYDAYLESGLLDEHIDQETALTPYYRAMLEEDGKAMLYYR